MDKALKQNIIDKYNVPVPRYTSYPPANYFAEMGAGDYRDAVLQSNGAKDRNLSFYIHFPYCPRLCHYCACNSYAMPQNIDVQRYIDALHKEIDMILPLLDGDRKSITAAALRRQCHYQPSKSLINTYSATSPRLNVPKLPSNVIPDIWTPTDGKNWRRQASQG